MTLDQQTGDGREDGPPRPRGRGAALGRYGAAAGLVGAANVVAYVAGPDPGPGNLAMIFLLGVLAAGAAFGIGPAILAALAAGVTYNFFFLDPRFTFLIAHPSDVFTYLVFFAVALATGWLSGRVRDQARRAARRAETVTALLQASRALSAASGADEAARALASQISAATGGAAMVLLGADAGELRLAGPPRGVRILSPASAAAARAAWETGRAPEPEAGGPEIGWDFQPLEGLHRRVGVVGLRRPRAAWGTDKEELLGALLSQGAVAIERAELASTAAENQALRDADKLRSALLSSISHDFRTPLSTVLGSATTLLDYEKELKPAVRRDLLKSIREDAERLNRYVGTLLDMARLEGGALKPKQDWVDVREVAGSAVEQVRDRLGRRKVIREFARPLSMVRADATLLEQALLNLLDNAVSHTPDGSDIEIAAFEDPKNVLISVEDQGPGVPQEARANVFDRFRRAKAVADRTGGLGLGLSITKGFVEAMGGRVAVVSPVADGRGARFLMSFPKASETPRGLL